MCANCRSRERRGIEIDHEQVHIDVEGSLVPVDKGLQGLMQAINAYPGIRTIFSCQGKLLSNGSVESFPYFSVTLRCLAWAIADPGIFKREMINDLDTRKEIRALAKFRRDFTGALAPLKVSFNRDGEIYTSDVSVYDSQPYKLTLYWQPGRYQALLQAAHSALVKAKPIKDRVEVDSKHWSAGAS
jgi:hypothetical protein